MAHENDKPINDQFVSNAIEFARHGRSSMEIRRAIGLRTMVVAIAFCLLIANGAHEFIGDVTSIFWFKFMIIAIYMLVFILYFYFIILIEIQSYEDRSTYKELEEKLGKYFLDDRSFDVGRESYPEIRSIRDGLKFITLIAWAATGPVVVVAITALGCSLFVLLLRN